MLSELTEPPQANPDETAPSGPIPSWAPHLRHFAVEGVVRLGTAAGIERSSLPMTEVPRASHPHTLPKSNKPQSLVRDVLNEVAQGRRAEIPTVLPLATPP